MQQVNFCSVPDRFRHDFFRVDYECFAARNGNAVFSAFKLRLQREEILVGFQIRIFFDHNHQA